MAFEYNQKNVLQALLILSVLALAAGYVAEYGFGLKPCVLCWYQRYAYMAAVAASFLGLGMITKPKVAKFAFLPVGFTYAANAFFAVYQVLVEKKIIAMPSLCKGVEIETMNQSFEEFQRQLQAAADYVPCDKVPWDLFGVSMAGYNAMFTLTVTLVILLLTMKMILKGSLNHAS